MARSASPWFWESRNLWAVIIDGDRHILGEHPDDAPPPRKKKNKWIVPKAIQDAFDDPLARPVGPGRPQSSNGEDRTTEAVHLFGASRVGLPADACCFGRLLLRAGHPLADLGRRAAALCEFEAEVGDRVGAISGRE